MITNVLDPSLASIGGQQALITQHHPLCPRLAAA
jgi:hypothetical protein